jgi:hypothetical protein
MLGEHNDGGSEPVNNSWKINAANVGRNELRDGLEGAYWTAQITLNDPDDKGKYRYTTRQSIGIDMDKFPCAATDICEIMGGLNFSRLDSMTELKAVDVKDLTYAGWFVLGTQGNLSEITVVLSDAGLKAMRVAGVLSLKEYLVGKQMDRTSKAPTMSTSS